MNNIIEHKGYKAKLIDGTYVGYAVRRIDGTTVARFECKTFNEFTDLVDHLDNGFMPHNGWLAPIDPFVSSLIKRITRGV